MMHSCQLFREDKTVVSTKCPDQMRGGLLDSIDDEQVDCEKDNEEDGRCGVASSRLTPEFVDGHTAVVQSGLFAYQADISIQDLRSQHEIVDISDPIAHCNCKDKSSDEANNYRGTECFRHRLLGFCAFFCEVKRCIKAGEYEARCCEARQECHAGWPACIAFHSRPDIFCTLFIGAGQASDSDNDKRAKSEEYYLMISRVQVRMLISTHIRCCVTMASLQERRGCIEGKRY